MEVGTEFLSEQGWCVGGTPHRGRRGKVTGKKVHQGGARNIRKHEKKALLELVFQGESPFQEDARKREVYQEEEIQNQKEV